MKFDRVWTKFALEAEYEHYGAKRICVAHNNEMAEVARLRSALESQEQRVREEMEWQKIMVVDMKTKDDKITAIVKWLEVNQPDVFSRGLWDAINAVLQPNNGA
jgi:hypothetical protein